MLALRAILTLLFAVLNPRCVSTFKCVINPIKSTYRASEVSSCDVMPLPTHHQTLTTTPRSTSTNLKMAKTYDFGDGSNSTLSWDPRETLPYILKTTTPGDSSHLGTHHLPPMIGKGDVIKLNQESYKVRRVRFLYKMESPDVKYRVTKKVLDVTRLGRERIERKLMKGLEGVDDEV